MYYLKLLFSSVMQYWYDNQRSHVLLSDTPVYKTKSGPTQSGVVGLLGNAMNIPRNSPVLQEWADKLDIKYRLADGAKRPRIFEDFQTVRPGDGQKFTKVDGGHEDRTMTKIVCYLEDAEFEVYVGGDRELLEQFHRAILNPAHNLYFGKRCCVPRKPIAKKQIELVTAEALEEMTHVHECV